MTRLVPCLFLAACAADLGPPVDVPISSRQYNDFAVKFPDGVLDTLSCLNLCPRVPIENGVACTLAVSNDGAPAVHCVELPPEIKG